MPAHLVQAYSKPPPKQGGMELRNVCNILENMYIGYMDMGQTNVIEISKDKATQS